MEGTCKLVKWAILYKKLGENSDTAPDPIEVWAPGMVDLAATGTFCLNWDDNRLVSCNLYSVHWIQLPDFLTPAEWLRNTTAWKWAWGMGADPTWPEAVQRWLAHGGLSTVQRLAAIKLLKTKTFRSTFRQSLCTQLLAWLAIAPDNRAHPSPFSDRQWEALLDRHLLLDAKRTDSKLYYGGRYRADGGVTLGEGLTWADVPTAPGSATLLPSDAPSPAEAVDPGCAHESVRAANGHGAFCRFCGETME